MDIAVAIMNRMRLMTMMMQEVPDVIQRPSYQRLVCDTNDRRVFTQ